MAQVQRVGEFRVHTHGGFSVVWLNEFNASETVANLATASSTQYKTLLTGLTESLLHNKGYISVSLWLHRV